MNGRGGGGRSRVNWAESALCKQRFSGDFFFPPLAHRKKCRGFGGICTGLSPVTDGNLLRTRIVRRIIYRSILERKHHMAFGQHFRNGAKTAELLAKDFRLKEAIYLDGLTGRKFDHEK